MKSKPIAYFAALILLLQAISCKTEKLLSQEFDPALLNGPIGIATIPGTDMAFVANSNYKLDYETGSLSVVDLSAGEILSEVTVKIPNFAGQILVDAAMSRVLVPNRYDDSLSVFNYTIPGSEGPIDLTKPELANGISGAMNQIEMEEDPFGIILAQPSGVTDRIYVTNVTSGDVTTLLADDLSIVKADNKDEDSVGIPLLALPSIGVTDEIRTDGIGANRMVSSLDKRLVFVTSSRSNYIFIIDTYDNKVEGVLDMGKYSSIPGMRGLAIDPTGLLFVAHRGMEGVIVLDVAQIEDNGIDNEIIEEVYIGFIPTGKGPEGIALDNARSKLYVCNEQESKVSVIDLGSLSVSAEIYTERGPTEIAVHPTNGKAYITNFISDSISVIDTATDTNEGVIK